MDERQKTRIRREQRALLNDILFTKPRRRKPPLEREMDEAARRKYASIVREGLALFYPFFSRYRRVSDAQLIALFKGGGTELDVWRNIEALYATLTSPRALRLSEGFRDLLRLERAMSHCRFGVRYGGNIETANRQLRKHAEGKPTRATPGLRLLTFRTSLGRRYPDLDPSRARRLSAPDQAALFLDAKGQLCLLLEPGA